MKVEYRGHEIEVKRERCLGGWSMLYYSIMLYGYECLSNFEDSAEKVATMIKYLKQRVDAELSEEMPWGEFSKNDKGELVISDGTE